MPSKLETAFKAGPVAKVDYTRDENLIAAYRFHRKTRLMDRARGYYPLKAEAAYCLMLAREDVANGVRRYSASASGWNPRIEAYGDKHVRWIENPAACGLRFVGYRRTFAEIATVAELKATLRNGGFAWPVGYPLFFATNDGATLSFEAVRQNFRTVADSIRGDQSDGWRVTACGVNWDDDGLTCDHSGDRIESAHGEEMEG